MSTSDPDELRKATQNLTSLSLSTSLTTFQLFTTLPPEIRLKIWRQTLPGPRTVDISIPIPNYGSCRCKPIVPAPGKRKSNLFATFWINRESRGEALKHYCIFDPRAANVNANANLDSDSDFNFDFVFQPICFNPHIDTLLLHNDNVIPHAMHGYAFWNLAAHMSCFSAAVGERVRYIRAIELHHVDGEDMYRHGDMIDIAFADLDANASNSNSATTPNLITNANSNLTPGSLAPPVNPPCYKEFVFHFPCLTTLHMGLSPTIDSKLEDEAPLKQWSEFLERNRGRFVGGRAPEIVRSSYYSTLRGNGTGR